MNTEEFLDGLAGGKFLDEIGDNLRDHDILQDTITAYAMDAYLGHFDGSGRTQELVIKEITKMMYQVIADFETQTVTHDDTLTLAEQYAENGVQQSDF